MKNKEVELSSIVTELELKTTLLKENLAKEESEKLVRLQVTASFLFLFFFLFVFLFFKYNLLCLYESFHD